MKYLEGSILQGEPENCEKERRHYSNVRCCYKANSNLVTSTSNFLNPILR